MLVTLIIMFHNFGQCINQQLAKHLLQYVLPLLTIVNKNTIIHCYFMLAQIHSVLADTLF